MRIGSVRTLAAIAFLIWFGCSTQQTPAVAYIGDEEISLDIFADRYKNFLHTAGVIDNLHFRHQFLNSLLDERLILQYAADLDLSNDFLISSELVRLKKQLLLNQLYEREIQSNLNVSEQELITMFNWSKTLLHVRHLFAKDRQGISTISERLVAGEKWELLAEEFFSDPVLAQNGGDLGFVGLGDLDPAFEKVAFRLRDGEISSPVSTSTGFSIIQVLDREVELFRTEAEFVSQRGYLEQIAYSHNKRPIVREYTDKIIRELDLRFHEQGLLQILKAIEARETNFPESFLPYSNLTCITVERDGKTFTAAETWLEMEGLSVAQRSRIETLHQLRQSLTGLIVRQELLVRARDLGIDNDPQFLTNWSRTRDNYLVTAVLQRLSETSDEYGRLSKAEYHQFIRSLRSNTSVTLDSLLLKRWLGLQETLL